VGTEQAMDQTIKDEKPKTKKIGKPSLINKAFDDEAIYS